MQLLDGRALAQDINASVKVRVSCLNEAPTLAILACNPNFETQKYLELKKRAAAALGISITVTILPKEADTEACLKAIMALTQKSSGIIVQLPLPLHIDTPAVLASIPVSRDVDAFSYHGEEGAVLPPVLGAIDEFSKRFSIPFEKMAVVIFGAGRLVGIPAFHYAKAKGASVTVLTELESAAEVKRIALAANIIILGVGKPGLLTAAMVKAGVVVFDAGASEDGGLLVGDAALDVAKKAAYLTPVPGGIGPVTIALLFRNLLDLSARQ